DGREAVELARRLRPDVVVLDVRMPGLDGLEAARQIQAARPTPLLLLTAYDDPELVTRAIDAGISAYLVKPYHPSALVPAIRTAVARHGELEELRGRQKRRSSTGTAARRDELLAAAARVFGEKGFAAASMQELAEAMSLKPTAVYHYFASKDELLAEVVAKAHTEAWQTVSRAMSETYGSRDALTAFVESLTTWADGRRHEASLLLQAQPIAEGAGRDEVSKAGAAYRNCITDLVRRGQADGELKGDVDPELAAAAILGAVAAVTSPARTVHGRDGRVLPSLVLAGLEVPHYAAT
ncbi:MAG TPA: response regulator, partial [Gaiellaceae bacterium]|nr:response regulator [Gaiellaceae bacterium]